MGDRRTLAHCTGHRALHTYIITDQLILGLMPKSALCFLRDFLSNRLLSCSFAILRLVLFSFASAFVRSISALRTRCDKLS